MAHVEIDPGRGDIVVTSEYRERELCRAVPGCRWDNDGRTWRIPLSWASCVSLRGVFGPALTIGPGLDAWVRNERKTRIDPCLILRTMKELPVAWPVSGMLDALDL